MSLVNRSSAFVAPILCSVIASPLVAQPAETEFAPGRFIIKVREGAEPCVLPGDFHTFTYGQDQNAESIAAELYIAAMLESCGVTGIEHAIPQYLQDRLSLRDDLMAIATEHGILRKYIVHVATGTDIGDITQILSGCATHVVDAYPDHRVTFLGDECVLVPPTTNDPLACHQWGLHNEGQDMSFYLNPTEPCPFPDNPEVDADIDAPEAWSLLAGNESEVVVAVIDSGVDIDNPDLVNKLTPEGVVESVFLCQSACDPGCPLLINPCDLVDPLHAYLPHGCFCDREGHGTHIASIIAAEGNNGFGMVGVAHQVARVKPYKIIYQTGADEALLDAATDPNVRIINMSIQVKEDLTGEIAVAVANNKLMYAAAGNQLFSCDGTQGGVTYPASDPFVVAVAATNWLDNRAAFSRIGSQIEVAAPGQRVVGYFPTYGTCQ